MPIAPNSAKTRNQPNITGPKIEPMKPVPLRWTKNSAMRMARVSGTMT
jgi:hypothetical protein